MEVDTWVINIPPTTGQFILFWFYSWSLHGRTLSKPDIGYSNCILPDSKSGVIKDEPFAYVKPRSKISRISCKMNPLLMPNQKVKYQEFLEFNIWHQVTGGDPDTWRGIIQRSLEMAFLPLHTEDLLQENRNLQHRYLYLAHHLPHFIE